MCSITVSTCPGDYRLVTSDAGKTENIRVIDAVPEGVFEKAAIRALNKWKYKAPIEEGVPNGLKNMTTRIRFELEG